VTKPEDVPTRNKFAEVPLALSPEIATVIRFAQDGMPVKSIAVPLVDATAVALVNGCERFAGVTFEVPIVPVPCVIVKSPARVVERLPIVPVVELNVPIVPEVAITDVELNVPIVPEVAITDVEFVVPEDRLVIVPSVEVVVPAVRFGIVPVVIVPVVLIVRFAETVPTVRTFDRFAFTYVPLVSASSNKL